MLKKTVSILSISLMMLFIFRSSITASQKEPAADSYVYLPIIMTPPGETPFGAVHTGEGTWYYNAGRVTGACLYPPSPENLMVAAMNHFDYDNSALCGAYVKVTGPDGTVTVRITDECADCDPDQVDLSREAFAKIGSIPDGRINIQWQLVSYPLTDPIVYHFKDGSNQWWTAVQIRNHSNPIAKVEFMNEGGSFQELPRTSYNYFIEGDGMGPGPYTFRVTDVFGNAIVNSGIPLVPDGDVSGSGQFPQP